MNIYYIIIELNIIYIQYSKFLILFFFYFLKYIYIYLRMKISKKLITLLINKMM